MKSPSEMSAAEDAPLYIRWSPDRSPYAIELKLELVARMTAELVEAEKTGVEIGGVLVGSFPDAQMPTLRVEDIEIFPPRAENAPREVAEAEQPARFSEIRWNLRRAGRAALGLFRSHLRPGPLRPSPADRNLLAEEFKLAVSVELLVQGRAPHSAAFFVGTHGELPDEPAVREFRFNETEFRALPEVEPEAPPPTREEGAPKRSNARLYGLVATLLLIGLAACILMWSFTGHGPRPPALRSAHQLRLAITGNGHLVRISWNHSAREMDGATGAKLMIVDGGNRRDAKLGLDELRLGSVEYERTTASVQATLTLERPGKQAESESAEWYPR